MTLPRTAADVLAEHVTLEVECIDRMYLNLYQPRLQHELGVVGFFKAHRGFPFVSSALMDPISKAFVAGIHRFVADQGVDLVDFRPGERKDDVAHRYLAGFDGTEGVLFVGRVQEKTAVFRTEKRRNPITGATYPWLVRRSAIVNHFYVYAVDDFGPFFIKFCTYFPYNAKVCINGNEWAKRQAAKAGIGFEALDNGFASCEDPERLQKICDRLDDKRIDRFVRKWLARLPHPFTAAERRAGYRYDISILQAEFSLTQVLDRPLAGRVFFEEVIRDNIDLGRPDRVSAIFDRRIVRRGKRPTPGRFRTRIFTDGVVPSLHVEYKASRVKQYHKEGVALRTETTVNDTRDFGVGKRLPNLPALREIGFNANRRLLAVQRISHDPADGQAALEQLTRPLHLDGRRIAALRFGDPRVHALLGALVVFRLLPNGFANRDLRAHVAPLLGRPAESMTAGQMTYDLRRLRLHGLIERIPGAHRYRPTALGFSTAVFVGHAGRFLRHGMADSTDPTSPLRAAIDRAGAQADRIARHARLAA
ncbi:MAG: hypothetical protein ACRD07_19980 [Acidimicrobiales bacterium]